MFIAHSLGLSETAPCFCKCAIEQIDFFILTSGGAQIIAIDPVALSIDSAFRAPLNVFPVSPSTVCTYQILRELISFYRNSFATGGFLQYARPSPQESHAARIRVRP